MRWWQRREHYTEKPACLLKKRMNELVAKKRALNLTLSLAARQEKNF
jgi:hypothetical protein